MNTQCSCLFSNRTSSQDVYKIAWNHVVVCRVYTLRKKILYLVT